VLTVLLLSGWTLWLVVAFPLVNRTLGTALAVLFVLAAVPLWAMSDVTWQSYLMLWLAVHVAIAAYVAKEGGSRKPILPAAVSTVGFGWLWIQGGAPYWQWALAIGVLAALGGAAGYLLLVRRRRRASHPPTPRPPQAPTTEPQPPTTEQSTATTERAPVTFPPSMFELAPTTHPQSTPSRAQPSWAPPPRIPGRKVAREVETPIIECPTGPDRHQNPAPRIPGITFDVGGDDGRPTGLRRTPRARPAAAQSDGDPDELLPVLGLARFFPRGTLHGTRTTAPPSEDACPLTETDHLHVRHLAAPLEPLLNPAAATAEALADLIRTRDQAAVAAFQKSLRQRPDANPGRQWDDVVITTVTDTVEDADGGLTETLTGGYVTEETVLPVVDLLADDHAAVLAFADAIDEERKPSSADRFLRALLSAAGLDADLAMLGPDDNAVFGLFGCAAVRRGCAVPVPVPDRPDDWWEAARRSAAPP
jgi:hypothetical protein